MGNVWINNQMIINGWLSSNSYKTLTETIRLTAGHGVAIQVDFAEKKRNANIKLEWSSTSNPKTNFPSNSSVS